MRLETLESRKLMSVAASVGAGTLYVYGDDNSNGLSIERANGGLDIVVKKYVSGTSYAEFYRTKASKVENIKIYGRGGADTITVGDYVPAYVTINGGAGPDYLHAGGIYVVGYGHDQNDATSDDNAADILVTGGSGECYLSGQGGNDKFYMDRSEVGGYGGADKFYGGSGNDRFYPRLDRRYGHLYSGGSGRDTVDFSDFGTRENIVIDGVSNSGPRFGETREKNHKILLDVENAVGTPSADFIRSKWEINVANNFYGMGGFDTIMGGGGDDLLDGGNDGDNISGENGNDTIYGGSGQDFLKGGNDADRIRGGGGLDQIFGDNGADKLYGDSGDDSITGGGSVDLLVGGSGDDYFDADDGTLNELIYGGNEDGKDGGTRDRAKIDEPSGPYKDLIFAIDMLL